MGPAIKGQTLIKRNSIRYWTLKFLNLHKGEPYGAVVLDELRNKYRVVMMDFLLVAEIHRRGLRPLKCGEEIRVVVRKADPWEDLLEVDWVESQTP